MTDEGPLITAQALAARADDGRLRICDVRWYLSDPGRGHDEYLAGHLPQAQFIDMDIELAAHGRLGEHGRHPLPTADVFAGRMAARGIGMDHDIVVYDTAGATVAARLWWMFDALGYRARVLDGGLSAWVAAGQPLEAGPVADAGAVSVPAVADWPRTIDRDGLRARLGDVTLLDARAGERYRGEVEPVDPVAGHIPTALSAPITENLGHDQRMLPPGQLASRLGVHTSSGRDVVVSCGSGVSACHLALAMRVAGLPDPILYPGSYSDWSVSGQPVATGPEPGGRPIR